VQDIQVVSWNIRKCRGLDGRRDPGRIARALAGFGSDIVALQEADHRLGKRPAALPEWLIDAETDLRVVDARQFDGSIGWHGNAVLIGPRVICDQIHALHLPGIEPRGALVADLSVETQKLRIVATHLGLLRRSRNAQLVAIRTHLATLAPCPTVIIGDFNEWSARRGFEALPGYSVHSPGRTFHSARPVAPLDRLALSAELRLTDAKVLRNEITRVASDHLPIWAGIALGD
jgi:endonuclease/exonuclease/phosphatase family metal-dependent hydrolase